MDGDTLKAYRNFVGFRQLSNPCVGGLSAFLASQKLPQDSCQIYAVDLDPTSNPGNPNDIQKVGRGNLSSILEPPPPGKGRLIVIEDLHPAVLEILGATLDIDPLFFADYVLTSLKDIEREPGPPSVALVPSQAQSQRDWLHVHYQQVVDLDPVPLQHCPWVFETLANVKRNVRRLPPLQGRQLGIARGCCSILIKRLGQSWIGVVLIDSTTSDIISSTGPQIRLRRKPLHDGFEEFQTPPSFSSFRSLQHHTSCHRSSLLQLLLSYLSQHPLVVQETAAPSPLNLAYYPSKIITGEWMLYGQLVARYLKHYEYALNDTNLRLHEDELVDLQKWRHRAIQTQVKLYSFREYISYHYTAESNQVQWQLLLGDLTYLSQRIDQYGQALERIIPVAMSIIQLYHYRRSVVESIYIKRLTYMALVFVPLSWVAAIFSMADDFAPGRPKFWIYFVVSVPFSLLLVIGSLLLSNSWAWTSLDMPQAMHFSGRKPREDLIISN